MHCTQKVDSAVCRTECLAWNSETTELLLRVYALLAHTHFVSRMTVWLSQSTYLYTKKNTLTQAHPKAVLFSLCLIQRNVIFVCVLPIKLAPVTLGLFSTLNHRLLMYKKCLLNFHAAAFIPFTFFFSKSGNYQNLSDTNIVVIGCYRCQTTNNLSNILFLRFK